MESGTLCMVTIHGIGFQQPPLDGVAGYADDLHQNLSEHLDATLLGDDPNRRRSQRGEAGPIYVQSSWPPGSDNTEAGLARLGTWGDMKTRAIDTTNAPLVATNERISHVALVYSHLEERSAKIGSALEATIIAALSLDRYDTLGGLIGMIKGDIEGILQRHPDDGPAPSSLRIRTDPGFKPATTAPYHEDASGPLATLRQLENDVAAYVCRNDLRERVRSFVRDALCRLAYRDDVAAIVVNSHSNGTLIAYDVLHELPPLAARKVHTFMTAGSPLRKYADLWWWGNEVGCIAQIENWANYWDARDPVADPLTPGSDWQPSQLVVQDGTSAFFQAVDASSGAGAPARLRDQQVDNLTNSRGAGLRAHNYWDNDTEFVQPLAALLRDLASGSTSAPSAEPVGATP